MIASSGHTMEYVGSGTDYSALPENGGVPDEPNRLLKVTMVRFGQQLLTTTVSLRLVVTKQKILFSK